MTRSDAPPPSDGKTFGLAIPFNQLCGIESLGFAEGRTQLRLVVEPRHANSHGSAHGGVLCTLLDVAMSTAARLTASRLVVTVDMQVRFLTPGRGTLLAAGWIVKGGRTLVFCEGEIRDAEGALVATASGVFKHVGEELETPR